MSSSFLPQTPQPPTPEKHDALQLLLAFGPAFARNRRFYKSLAYALLLGSIMGGAGLAFFNGFQYLFDYWTGEDYEHRMKGGELGYGSGEFWWLGVTTGGGAIIGILRLHPAFPAQVDGLFREVRDLTVHHPAASPLIFIVSCLSLGIGASVGPEAAMGNLGGALGTAVGNFRNQSDRRKLISAFCGMSGAMGAIFPSPVLAVMLMHELSVVSRPGDPRFNAAVPDIRVSYSHQIDNSEFPTHEVDQHDFMEQVSLAGAAATAGFAVFYGIAGYTFLDPGKVPIATYEISKYEVWHLAAAVPLGIVAGILGIITLVMIGVFRKVNNRLTTRLKDRGLSPKLVSVLMPTLAGLLFGLIGVAWPLTLGDGAMQIPWLIKNGYAGTIENPIDPDNNVEVDAKLTIGDLIGTLFGKLLSMAICLGLGMVGGQIFPCIFAGVCAGIIATRVVPDLPISLTVPCMMSAVPAAFAPIPFSLVGLVTMILVLDGSMAAPIFVSTFVSFITNCGLGVVQGVLERQNDLKGVMTTVRNNNQHSILHENGEGFSYRKMAGSEKDANDMDSTALQDVSEIIFAAEPATSNI